MFAGGRQRENLGLSRGYRSCSSQESLCGSLAIVLKEFTGQCIHCSLLDFCSSSLFSLCISPLADSSSYSTKLVIAA